MQVLRSALVEFRRRSPAVKFRWPGSTTINDTRPMSMNTLRARDAQRIKARQQTSSQENTR